MRPLLGSSSPISRRSTVVLPQPEGPRRERQRSRGSEYESPLIAAIGWEAKRLHTFRIVTAGVVMGSMNGALVRNRSKSVACRHDEYQAQTVRRYISASSSIFTNCKP